MVHVTYRGGAPAVADLISGYVQVMIQTEDETQRSEYAKLVLKQFDSIAAMQRALHA